jgi:hypothetical protein
MKKSFIMVMAVAMLASMTFAETEITLFSWEDLQPGFDMSKTDGYLFISAGDPEYGMAVTDGNWAMAVDVKDGFQHGLMGGIGFDYDWTPYFPMLSNAANSGGKLRIDVTTSNSLANVPMSSGIQLNLFIQGNSGLDPGFFKYNMGYKSIQSVYYNPNNYPVGSPMYQTVTLEWDLTVDSAGNPAWFPSAWEDVPDYNDWADLRINTNVIAGATNAGIIIIDNVRVILGGDNCLWGDFNSDGVVDIADYTVWADNFGVVTGSHVHGDGNDDGAVDIADYTIWADNFGATSPVSVP